MQKNKTNHYKAHYQTKEKNKTKIKNSQEFYAF